MSGFGKLVPAAAAAAIITACQDDRVPDFYVHGTGIVVESAAPFVEHEDLPARIESTLGAALAYWGGGWRDLEGSTITLVDAQYVACGTQGAVGCNDGNISVSTRDPGLGQWQCVEQTVLVHEVGHSVIGDRAHADPRWMDFAAVADGLSGRTGYTSGGEVPCALFPSVWQHPNSR